MELGASASTFDIAAAGIAPGDQIERILDLKNSSTQTLSQIVLSTTADPSSVLVTDTTGGLQMTVERCSTPWTEIAGDSPSYSCDGTLATVVAERSTICWCGCASRRAPANPRRARARY